ncbi:MAG: NYN domain-containing protein [Methylotenera sp.]|nr:NYN domain-containing protein [Methylotenera sp.]
MNDDKNNPRLAVLIDADNARASIVTELLAEIANLGTANIKRIYGDWTEPNLGSWKETLLKHSIQPIQQFRNTVRKNATDSAMIIDAMDLLHNAPLDGFCIVSSDSDFTRLAARVRESGKLAYGFGEKKTPEPFRMACDRFIYIENLISKESLAQNFNAPILDRPTISDSANQSTATQLKPTIKAAKIQTPDIANNTEAKTISKDAYLKVLFRSAINASSGDDGWASLGVVGSNITKKAPDFDSRTYGYAKLSELTKTLNIFETKKIGNHLFLRLLS